MSKWSNYRYIERRPPLSAGNYRAVIIDVEETKSKSGNDMLVIELRISGGVCVKDYIVANDYFDENISRLFDAFPEIGVGNFNFMEWIGAMGAVRLKIDDEGYAKVHYYLTPDKAENLPEFEGKRPERQTVTSIGGTDFEDVDPDDDCPF